MTGVFGAVKVRTTGLTRRARLRRWLGESPVTYWAAAVFIGLLMAGIVVVLLPASWFGGGSDGPTEGASLPSVAADSSPVCAEQAPSGSQDGLLVPSWTMIGATPTPQSATGGPVLQTIPRQCFAHSPEGAVYAAASVLSEMSSVTDSSLRKQVVTQRFSHTGDYAKVLAAAARPFTAPTARTQYVGYQISSADAQVVQLELATRAINGPDAGIVNAIGFTMTWENNDWLLVPPPATGLPVRSLTDFTGFTPWGQAG